MLLGHKKTATIDDSAVSDDHVKAAAWNEVHVFDAASIIPVGIVNVSIVDGVVSCGQFGLCGPVTHTATGTLSGEIVPFDASAGAPGMDIAYVCTVATPFFSATQAGWSIGAGVSGDQLSIYTTDLTGTPADISDVNIVVTMYARFIQPPPPI